MDMNGVRSRLPFALAIAFFAVAYSRPAHRSAWIIMACVLLTFVIIRSRRPRG